MKKSVLFSVFILLSGIVFASKKPPIYVAAIGGISLRESPNKSGVKIETLPYGTRISNYNDTFEWDTIDGYWSNWARVAINGKDGYIFKGYTIPVQPPLTSNTFSEYLGLITGQKGVLDSVMMSNGGWIYNYSFKKFINYSHQCDMYCSMCVTNLNMSIQEAYLLLYLLEYFNNNFWNEFYPFENQNQKLSSSFPKLKAKNYLVNDFNSLVYEDVSMHYSIIRNGDCVNITWEEYP